MRSRLHQGLKALTLAAVLGAAPALAQGEVPMPPAPSSDAPKASAKATMAPGAKEPALATDEGWNAQWALLFSLSNFFVNGQFLLAPTVGSIGANYFLDTDTAVRAGVTLARSHSPSQVVKTVNTTGGENVTTYSFNGGGETHTAIVRAEYLKRLMPTAVAPYVGAGGQLTWSWTRNVFLDDLSVVDQRTEQDNHQATTDLTVRGIVGAEWRIHPNFALYADYNVSLSLINVNNLSFRTTVENTVGGAPSTVTTTQERQILSYLGLSTGLSQGASLGLEVFF